MRGVSGWRAWCLGIALVGCDEGGGVGEVPDGAGGVPGQGADANTPDGAFADAGGGAGGAGGVGLDGGLAGAGGGEVQDPEPLDLETILARVDPFIGTGGQAFNYGAQTPAAQVPLGMVRLGPDTTRRGLHPDFHHFSGYHFDDPDVRGFSHTHFVGTGIADYGNLRVLPWRGELAADAAPGRFFTALDKATERAEPGLYQVRLPDQDVDVSLTATTRAGVHRYRFGTGGRVRLLIDAAASVADRGVEDARILFSGTGAEGEVTYRGPLTGRTRPFTLYFVVRASQSPLDRVVWDASGVQAGAGSAQGDVAGAGLEFEVEAGEVIELRVGVSFIDLAQARQNLAEVEAQSFEDVAAQARAAWAGHLGRVRIAGGTEAEQRTFYTALYHTLAMPTRLDEGGRYRGLDGEVHDTQHPYFTDLSLWDTFRTLHPWYLLVAPEVQRDCLLSLLRMGEDGGVVPRWPAGLSYGESMIGTSADLLFAESALKGLDGVDYDAAFDALWVTAGGPTPAGLPGGRDGMEDYLALGYVPSDRHGGSVSNTVEFAYSDWALGLLATHLERPEAAMLVERGQNHLNVFDPAQKFFAPRRADGTFEVVERQIYMGEGPYVEGSPWHWRFSALQDPEGLAEQFGGPEALAAELTTYFSLSGLGRPVINHATPDFYYWHGNEPTLHTTYLWHAAGRPDALADWLRAIQARVYTDTPAGLPGNDDGGTLSSWYLWSALGLYPVAGSDQYILGSPLFPYAEIDTVAGTLVVRAPGADQDTRYVARVTLGGAPVEGWRIDHASLLSGLSLSFRLQDQP